MILSVGNLVTYASAPGIGRVGQVMADCLRVDFFESAAEPIAESVYLTPNEVRRVTLGVQSRVFFQTNGRWQAGRIVGGGPSAYFVHVPNVRDALDLDEGELRIRWEKPPRDPLQVLLAGANETPRFRDVREPVRRLLLEERAAAGSATGIVSSGVRLHAHQVNAALRVIRDPIQRYLLADEVGMGKTIQAGMVLRQMLIDHPGRTAGVIVPDALIPQWESELRDKFYVDDFLTAAGTSPVRVLGHSQPASWADLSGVDLLVVDEAHVVARTPQPDATPYRQLAELAHAAPCLLLLSATPFSQGATTQLALLHLLDPELFRWDRAEAFRELLEARHALALAVFGLDNEPDVDNPGLLQLQFDEIAALLPDDLLLQDLIDRTMAVFGLPGTPPEDVDVEALQFAVSSVRTHVSETYRIHHRVIRNRRHAVAKHALDDEGLLTPFEFTGRRRPRAIRLASMEASLGADIAHRWLAACSSAILDEGLDARSYAHVMAMVVARVGGPADDLQDLLAARVGDELLAGGQCGELGEMVAAPVLTFERDLLDELRAHDQHVVLAELAEQLAGRIADHRRAVVFCGRGSLAEQLAGHISRSTLPIRVFSHLADQSDGDREDATTRWRAEGGALVADESGEVGRNFQDADCVIHVRLPSDLNALEQRIGRVDRYGRPRRAVQYVVADAPDGLVSAWARLLMVGFGIFDDSVSAMEEVVGFLSEDAWTALLTDGIEAMSGKADEIKASLAKERRRINELDALESSFDVHSAGNEFAREVAAFEGDGSAMEAAYRRLIVGAEGYRFAEKPNLDGSITFERDQGDRPLVSDRLLSRMVNVREAKTGFFDRWRLTPGRRLFRRGNPFIDGMEALLDLDDRGQAVAMWRLDVRWRDDPMPFFGFDYVIETDLSPIRKVLADRQHVDPVVRRRADAALPPASHRVWLPVTTRDPVRDERLVRYLDQPLTKPRDVNLNLQRIRALHGLLGGEGQFSIAAQECAATAREHVMQVAHIRETSRQAAEKVRRETAHLLAQSNARSRAHGLVADPDALQAEIAMSDAIEAGVSDPAVRLSSVSCIVVSSRSWADYV